jgi:hypothetical protein
MHRIRLAALLALCLPFGMPAAQAGDKPKPIDTKRALAHIVPDKRDLAWTKVPWHATLWDAVIEANEKKKPILLWAMNGHALACT